MKQADGLKNMGADGATRTRRASGGHGFAERGGTRRNNLTVVQNYIMSLLITNPRDARIIRQDDPPAIGLCPPCDCLGDRGHLRPVRLPGNDPAPASRRLPETLAQGYPRP
jgi:hypothetical protein